MSSARLNPRTNKPLLPLNPAGPVSHSNDSSLASNASETPIHTFKITAGPFLHSPRRINISRYKKENDAPPEDARGVGWRPATIRSRSYRLATGSLRQREYHHEPYPPTLNSSGSVSPSPTELCLPPFNSPSSPKLAHSLLFARSRAIPDSPTFWLAMYFCFNLGLTLYNKGVLVRFPFPYTLSALHALFGTIGGTWLATNGHFVPSRLSPRKAVVLVTFSILYAINIVVSNVSLQLVTVPFHQVVRAATPIFTILFSGALLGSQSSRSKKISLIPVVAGVGLATFGDYYFTCAGFLLTLLGTLLAALKTIFTNVSSRPHFSNPFDLLFFLSPLAFMTCLKMTALCANGCIAFGLNVVSFSANRRVGALGMTVAANVKQVLTIVCAVVIFNLTITPLNALGILLTLVGGAWYASIELAEKQRTA
ncbi:hypothetical protein B0H11DRAFT_1970631 [Mycena galericulata]|nr:hypothetical protein B0H11DRAFT_1970631 [Mycena galericulata]